MMISKYSKPVGQSWGRFLFERWWGKPSVFMEDILFDSSESGIMLTQRWKLLVHPFYFIETYVPYYLKKDIQLLKEKGRIYYFFHLFKP